MSHYPIVCSSLGYNQELVHKTIDLKFMNVKEQNVIALLNKNEIISLSVI